MFKDAALVLKKLLKQPRVMGSILPSSKYLCRRMLQEVSKDVGPVIELGPGTGVLTKQILAKGISPENLTLIELDGEFCDLLHQKFPDVRVERTGAQNLTELNIPLAEVVLSSLPMLAFPLNLQRDIIKAILSSLKPDGLYVQFTYGRKCPISPEIVKEFDLKHRTYGRVWANVPPAEVYEFRQIQH